MDSEFKMCNHCGETFFKEHIAVNGKCKLCNEGHTLIYYAHNNTEDE